MPYMSWPAFLQSVRDAVDALLELGYDPSMKGRLLRSAYSLQALRYSGASIRKSAELLMATGTAPRVARYC
jgi:hypothetical protein